MNGAQQYLDRSTREWFIATMRDILDVCEKTNPANLVSPVAVGQFRDSIAARPDENYARMLQNCPGVIGTDAYGQPQYNPTAMHTYVLGRLQTRTYELYQQGVSQAQQQPNTRPITPIGGHVPAAPPSPRPMPGVRFAEDTPQAPPPPTSAPAVPTQQPTQPATPTILDPGNQAQQAAFRIEYTAQNNKRGTSVSPITPLNPDLTPPTTVLPAIDGFPEITTWEVYTTTGKTQLDIVRITFTVPFRSAAEAALAAAAMVDRCPVAKHDAYIYQVSYPKGTLLPISYSAFQPMHRKVCEIITANHNQPPSKVLKLIDEELCGGVRRLSDAIEQLFCDAANRWTDNGYLTTVRNRNVIAFEFDEISELRQLADPAIGWPDYGHLNTAEFAKATDTLFTHTFRAFADIQLVAPKSPLDSVHACNIARGNRHLFGDTTSESAMVTLMAPAFTNQTKEATADIPQSHLHQFQETRKSMADVTLMVQTDEVWITNIVPHEVMMNLRPFEIFDADCGQHTMLDINTECDRHFLRRHAATPISLQVNLNPFLHIWMRMIKTFEGRARYCI